MSNKLIKVGDKASIYKQIKDADIKAFAEIVGDNNPIHTDPQFAANTEFKVPIVQGMLTGSLISSVLGTKLPGPGCIYINQNMNFVKPVKVNDIVTAIVEVVQIKTKEKSSIILLKTFCMNQDNEIVVFGDATMKAPK